MKKFKPIDLDALNIDPKYRRKMSPERAKKLSEAFGCDRYHLFTGHPLLRSTATSP